MYLTPSFVIARIVLYGVIGAAGIAIGTRMSERASPASNETFSTRFAIPIVNDEISSPRLAIPIVNDEISSPRLAIPIGNNQEVAAYRRHVDVVSIEADFARAERGPQSFAMRFGLVELLPSELTQFATGGSASLRASLEAAVAAAIDATVPANAASTAASHLR
jgi:hypothetical protein